MPSAHAPNPAASSASARLVMPQILTRGEGEPGEPAAGVATSSACSTGCTVLDMAPTVAGACPLLPAQPSGVLGFSTELGRSPRVALTVLCSYLPLPAGRRIST